MRNTVALVLAGGENKEFSVLTHNRAKSALPFCGHFRVVDFVLTNLSKSGIYTVGVMIQYLPGSLIEHIGVGHAWDFDFTNRRIKLMPPFVGVGKTNWFRGSGDAIYQNLDFVSDNQAEDVLVLCADHVYCMDYRPFLEYHRERNADLTILTTKRLPDTDPKHYGYVEVAPNGRVREFIEKPDAPLHDTVSTGVYLFKASVLSERLEEMNTRANDHHLPTAVIEPLVREGRAYAYSFQDDWNYLPDIEAYLDFHQLLLREESTISPNREQIMTDLRDRDLGSRPAPYFGPLSRVQDSMISPGCVVEGEVIGSVLSPGVRVGPKASIRDSIIFHDCVVGEGARLERVVSDKDAEFGAYCRVGAVDHPKDNDEKPPITVIGKGARILGGVRVEAGRVAPIKKVITQDWKWE